MRKIKIALTLFFGYAYSFAYTQNVGINATGVSPHASAGLDINFSNKGFLIPRVSLMGTTDATTITGAALSLMVYNLATTADVSPGYYYWTGTSWQRFFDANSAWSLIGNSGTSSTTNFIGTTDFTALIFKANNILFGRLDPTNYNISFGYNALPISSGTGSIALGREALFNNAGHNNIAIGYASLNQNTTANTNIAIGLEALRANTTGEYNIAIGRALKDNTTQSDMIAIGNHALLVNVDGEKNLAIGSKASENNSSGDYNLAIGYESLRSNNTGNYNTCVGHGSLSSFSSNPAFNSTLGYNALAVCSGSHNVAVGANAGYYALGVSLTSCTFVGSNSSLTVNRSNVTMLGNSITNAQCTNSNQVLLGNIGIIQIRAQVTGITAYSDKRIKKNIQQNVPGLSFINLLKPVTYNFDSKTQRQLLQIPDSITKELDFSDVENMRYIGFLAQDVEQAAKACNWQFPGLDAPHNTSNGLYTLRYVDFIMPLVKSVQELSQQNELLKQEIELLKAAIKQKE